MACTNVENYTTPGKMYVMNVANPAAPALLGSCAIGISAESVLEFMGVAYVSCYGSGIDVVDVGDAGQADSLSQDSLVRQGVGQQRARARHA